MTGGTGGEALGKVLVAMAQVRIGRILLWILATLLGLMALALHGAPDAIYKVPLAIAVVFATLAVVGARKARRGQRRSPIRWLLPRVALAVAGLGIVALLLWLKGRRRPVEALPPPPRPEEVDELASAALEGERAA
jgi:hypothetical protein